MRTIKGFSKIQTRNKIFGLEFFDLLLLLSAYLIVFVFSSNLILNSMVVAWIYFVLRIYKKNKPPHWTKSVFHFLLSRKKYSSRLENQGGIFQS